MVKNIISKTIVFIAVLLFVTVFKSIFGDSNMMVGVMTLVLTLTCLGRNLTVNAGKNLLGLLVINLALGLCAFVVTQNIWLGLVINFAVMFLIAYFFSYELRKPLNMLVGLHYVLMITAPISVSQLPMRIIALIAGPLFLMGVQLLFNRNKVKKSVPNLLAKIEDSLLTKINLLKQCEDVAEINKVIMSDMNSIKVMVHDSTPHNTNVSTLGRSVISVLSCLERIDLLLDNPVDGELLSKVETSLREKNPLETTEKSEVTYEFMLALELLHQEQSNLKNLLAESTKLHEKNESIANDLKERTILKQNFNFNSIRFGYGIRLGVLVAITSFITTYFNLEYGHWLVYTVFALTQPFVEFTLTKSKKRIIGTTIGAIIIFVAFTLIQDSSQRLVILLIGGYLLSYMVDYQNAVICITIASLASAAMVATSPGVVVFNRLFFVIVGIIISVIVNKMFLKSTYADEEVGISNLKTNILNYMFNEIYGNEQGGKKTIDHLYLIPSFIESRIEHWDLSISEERLYKQRWLMNYLHQIYLQINLNPLSQQMINDIKPLIQGEEKEIVMEKLNDMMNETEDLKEWQMCSHSLTLVKYISTL